jgi:hypothetical protein
VIEVEINFTLGQIMGKRFQICSTIGEAHQKAAMPAIKEAVDSSHESRKVSRRSTVLVKTTDRICSWSLQFDQVLACESSCLYTRVEDHENANKAVPKSTTSESVPEKSISSTRSKASMTATAFKPPYSMALSELV